MAAGALALALASALAGCGDEDDGKSSKPGVVSLELTQEAPGKLRLTVPDQVAPGVVRLELKNSTRRAHELQLVRVRGRHFASDVKGAFRTAADGGPIPDWLRAAGGVGGTRPGATGVSVQELRPGLYYALDPSEPEGDGGRPYYEQGAMAAIRVSGDRSAARLPAEEASVTALDYRFVSRGLRAGTSSVELRNDGKEQHHLIAAPIRAGSTIADVRQALRQEQGEPPLDLSRTASTPVLDGGGRQLTQLRLRRGRYALLCFVSDRRGGPPHVAKGMVTEARVE